MNKRIKAKDHPMTKALHDQISTTVALARDITEIKHIPFRKSLLMRMCAAMAHVQSLITMLLVNEGCTADEVIKLQEIGDKLVDDMIQEYLKMKSGQTNVGIPVRPVQIAPAEKMDVVGMIRAARQTPDGSGQTP